MSPLYQSRFSQASIRWNWGRWKALAEIYTMHSVLQLESNLKKRFWKASSGQKTKHRRRNKQNAAMQRGLGEVEKKGGTQYSALTMR